MAKSKSGDEKDDKMKWALLILGSAALGAIASHYVTKGLQEREELRLMKLKKELEAAGAE